MNTVTQLIQTTPDQLKDLILSGVEEKFNKFFSDFQPQQPTEYLTRSEVKDLLSISYPTLHDWCKKGILNPYRLGNRVYFKRAEVEQSLKQINP